MKEELKITETCKLVRYEYSKEVSLEYVEHSPDSWYSDNETSIDLDKAMAEKIVTMLRKVYSI
ncbi:hypothetical protein [Endozoicomonas acroporae]|uniref:hypothetical protein n=1 Tax=Endozoicomonas acroporae TaxID=1701104 RepID=UPI0013D15767|nr:hypothetical protein [Endozoicomonas acroporae]